MNRRKFDATLADPAPVIAKYADEIADAVMAAIARAGIDQGQEISLDARSLFVAVRSGVVGYLTADIAKARLNRKARGNKNEQ